MTKDRDPAEIIARLHRALQRGSHPPGAETPIPVVFLNQTYQLAAGREQLLEVLVAAFEDVVHLNQRAQESASALREVNVQLQVANSQLEQRNRQLQDLADELAESVRKERQAHDDLKRAESQLVQMEKLSALGQMVAGIAHEINNPLAFASNNLAVLQRDVAGLRDLLRLYQEAEPGLKETQPQVLERVQAQAERIDLPYTLENLEGLMLRSRDGLKRIQQIVKGLRDFARLDESDLHPVNLNEGIEATLDLVRSQANRAKVSLEAQLGTLPRVTCYPA
ncbi:MAG: hybrid sensor histidine kinase/response regulator, partial [Planctomycetes bacterium]|nr:hybrid sensor histidine kinase/response regulator [Planctomycetota bacterium]